ncbi:MAG: hypothetical protein NTZ30_00085 [Planctomycetota bacterium]|nr:hypothetical protein [Planctomycetota bacterium]
MIRLFVAIIFGCGFLNVSLCVGQQAKKNNPAGLDVANLKLEVDAFEFLRSLGLKKGQLKQLNDLVKDSKVVPLVLPVNSPPVFSSKYHETLKALRDAYVANNVDAIDKANEELEKVLENESVEVDYLVPVSDGAMLKAGGFFKIMRLFQVAILVRSSIPEDYEGAGVKMMQAVFEFPKLNDDEKNELSEIIVESVVALAAGVDVPKRVDIKKKILSFLGEVKKLKSPATKPEEKEFRDKAMSILREADVDVMKMLKNMLDFELAKQLSNPQFVTALSKFKVE